MGGRDIQYFSASCVEYFHTSASCPRPNPQPRRIGLLEKPALFATVTSPLSQQWSSLPPLVRRATEPSRRSLLASSARTKAALRVEEPLRLNVWSSHSAEQTAPPQRPPDGLLTFMAIAQQATQINRMISRHRFVRTRRVAERECIGHGRSGGGPEVGPRAWPACMSGGCGDGREARSHPRTTTYGHR